MFKRHKNMMFLCLLMNFEHNPMFFLMFFSIFGKNIAYMARSEYIATLKTEAVRIAAELAAIQNLIRIAEGGDIVATVPPAAEPVKRHKTEYLKPEGIPKGGNNWETYVQIILKNIGGRGKTQDVVAYAKKANPKESDELILNAVRGKLSKLYRNKTIGAVESESKSEGYEYFIKDDTK